MGSGGRGGLVSRPDFDEDDLAYLDQLVEVIALAADLDADRLDAADLHWSGLLMTDEEEDELERLEFLERTAGLDSEVVYPRRLERDGEAE